MSNFKDTLNILKTDFEMKANLNVKEPQIQQKWLNDKVYQQLLTKNKQEKQWILHDGPPYANGDIHVGHSLNKIIKDIIVRYKNMQGFYSEYIPGWDTHGLPIEHALMKTGENRDPKLTVNQKRDNCKQFASKWINKQKAQFARLGLLTDFSKTYETYTNDYEARQLEVILLAFKRKLIFQDLKPVYWSWSSQTALAEGEIEYADVKSHSVFVSFTCLEGNKHVKKGDKFVIWTTTPWTLPSNLAIAVNPKFTYVRVKVNNEIYVVAKTRLEAISSTLKWTKYEVISELQGVEIENVKYQHPIYIKRTSPIILAEYVSDADGTGLVHNAPGFGADDYLACKKYNIEPFAPIDNYGKFTKEVQDEQLVGIFYEDANEIIIKQLEHANVLLASSMFTHSAAHDWRTKKPVIYRATKQWFIDIKQIQNELVTALKQVSFINESNRRHIEDMIENRVEWCISRQRIWGVPIPVIFNDKDEPILDYELIKHICTILEKEGTNVWFEKPVEYFLTKQYQDNRKYRKETDTMDVWFDSGTSWTLLATHNLNYPADLYYEGNDQYRGWFNSSLINSVIVNNKAPFKWLLSHGMVLDEQGRKMSKSIGNVIDPIQVCNKLGADILRLWVASTNYQDDVRISDNILNQIAEIYRRIRNTLFKFCLANISDFDYETDKQTEQELYSEVDLLILNQLDNNIKKINEAYEKYDFATVVRTINSHVIELSGWYFDLIKDALYCELPNDKKRRTIQTVLFTILKSYLILLTPIIPHTCEEVYTHFNIKNKQSSVILESWIHDSKIDSDINLAKWDHFAKIKDVVYVELEKIRSNKIINKNNQALVEIKFSNKFNFTEHELAKYLNVAKVKIIKTSDEQINVSTSNANLVRCERCWNYYEKDQMHDEQICKRCDNILENKSNSLKNFLLN